MAANEEAVKLSIHHEETVSKSEQINLKLDPHGYPLRPQPTEDPMDPLNWPFYTKILIIFQVSFLAFLGPFTQAIINSAFVPLAKSLHITVVQASYQTTVPIVFAGVAPLLWSPIANIYGRRPIFIFVSALGITAHAASGAAQSWAGILVSRAFVGIGTSAGMGIGACVVADLFFMHERGRWMGFYVVFLSNGAHLAAVVGGFVAKYAGWRWCYWLGAIILGASFIVNIFLLPETLYHREASSAGNRKNLNKASWIRLLTFRGVKKQRNLKLRDFSHVFLMLKYPSVLFPALCYSVSFGYGSVLFAVTGAAAFGAESYYGFDTVGVGLAIGLSTFIGTLVGEVLAGPVSDRILYLYRKKHAGDPKPEARLQAMWPGFVLLPIGIVIEGVTLQYKTHWMGPVMGIGIGAFGLQILSTNIFAYITDCYKPQSAEISTLLGFGRQTFSFTLGFYTVPFAEETTWGIAWGVFAIIEVLTFVPVLILMQKGHIWRERLGAPDFHKDL